MAKQRVIDLTRTYGVCGDIVVYVLDEAEADPELEEIIVIHHDFKELEEVAQELKKLGFKTIELIKKDKAVLRLRPPRNQKS